jgi:competence protein ComEC
MTARSIVTRFRAYQLGSAGNSFSFFTDKTFTLIEARINDASRPNLDQELSACGKSAIDVLHITGWDQDHCAVADLEEILSRYKPAKIEYPGYLPHTDTAKDCLRMIQNYKTAKAQKGQSIRCVRIDPDYIKGLNTAEDMAYKDILYHPRRLFNEDSNNNSTVKVFREGCFNVASLGDVEDATIGSYLRSCKIFKREVDVLLLAHHGADCHTNSKSFFETIQPRIAICGSQFDNQFEHPKPEVRKRLSDLRIPIMTTKTGDVLIQSLPPHTQKFRAINLIANSTKISSSQDFVSRKFHCLSMNADTLRNLYKPGFKGLK